MKKRYLEINGIYQIRKDGFSADFKQVSWSLREYDKTSTLPPPSTGTAPPVSLARAPGAATLRGMPAAVVKLSLTATGTVIFVTKPS